MQYEYYPKLSIIVLGETGSGKSLFCKLFSKRDDFFSLKSPTSVTTQIISRTFKNELKKVEIELIDTPGFNDSNGEEQDKINLELISKYLAEHNQRINCVIIVMNGKIERVPNSIKKVIKNICALFPLPDFWSHVIIFWTHWNYIDAEEEEYQKNFINNRILNEFKELSNKILEGNRINPIQNNLNMIFNEYSEVTTNPEKIRINTEKSEINFNKIIDLAKDMLPLYKQILDPNYKIEQQEPLNGTIINNYTQYKYKKILIRKYKDFHNEEIIERPETLFSFLVQEIETDWEICPQESTELVKKYKKYKKRIFIDEENNEFEPGSDINISKMEIKREKTVKRKENFKLVEGNPKRKKIFEYDEVKYSDLDEVKEENIELKKEVEEGETEWIQDTNFNVPNIKRNVKYKTITEYDNNGNKISVSPTNEEIDWEKIETKIENNIPQIIDENITNYLEKTTILKTTKNNPNPIEIPGGSTRIQRTEIFKDEFDEPVKNLDKDNIGDIKYNCYRVKYINNVKQNDSKTSIPQKSYVLYYKKDNEIKTKKEIKNGKEYEIKYNEIYMVDSRDNNKKHPTNHIIIIGEEEINIKTKIDTREIIEGDMVIHQNYKTYYKVGDNGKDIFIKEEPEGQESKKKIKLGDEYCIIESPMTLDIINEMRANKKYPITYKRIYYQNEINTIRKERIETGKIENIELKLNKFENKEINEDNKFITFKTEFREYMSINGEDDKNYKIIDNINTTYDLIIKSDIEETYENEMIIRQKYIYYYYFSKGQEIFDHKEKKEDNPIKEKIEYGDIYYEIKPISNYCINPYKRVYDNYNYIREESPNKYLKQKQIQIMKNKKEKEIKEDIKKESINIKQYPIIYDKIYFKNEINTKRKLKKEEKVEHIEIKLEHIIHKIESKDKKNTKIEEYDIEVMYINGKLDSKNENNKMNYKETNIYKYEEKVKKGSVSRWFTADEHHFDIYQVTEIVYPDGKTRINRDIIKSDVIERYNNK